MGSIYIPDFTEMLMVAQSRGADSEAPGLWDGLVGDWPLAEGGGVDAFDLSGYGNDSTLTSMDPATDWVVGEKGPALEFVGGSSQYAAVGSAAVTAYPFSIIAWFRSTDLANLQSLVWVGDTSSADRWCALAAQGNEAGDPVGAFTHDYGGAGGAQTALTTSGYTSGVWHMAAGVWFSKDLRKAYIDGGSEGSNANSVDPMSGHNATALAGSRDSSPGQYLTGALAYPAIWNRPFALSEIQQLYAEPYARYTMRKRVYGTAVAPTGHAGPLVNSLRLKSKLKGLAA